MSELMTRSTTGASPGAPTSTAPVPGTAPTPARPIAALTGLRFFAAFAVFVYHAVLVQLSTDPALRTVLGPALGGLGYLGVSFFFVLSGFVLTWSYRGGEPVRRFWTRRFARVLPNHVVTFAVVLVVLVVAGMGAPAASTVSNFFLVQAWVPNYGFTNSVNGVAWSLSCEMFFYLAFPLLHRVLRQVSERRMVLCFVAVAALVVLVPVVAYGVLPATPRWSWGNASYLQIWFVYAFPLTRCFEFLLGMVVARLVASGRWRGPGRGVCLALLVVAYAASRTLPILYVYAAVTAVPVALTIGAFASARSQGGFRVLSSATMVRLGEVSFAFYLVHHAVVTYLGGALARYARSGLPVFASIVGAFVLSLALAWALHVLVERPIVRAVTRRDDRVRTVTTE